MDHYKLITVNHKNLNTEDLQHFVLRVEDDSELKSALEKAKLFSGQSEILYLSTCNRILFFFYGKEELSLEKSAKLFQHINPLIDDETCESLKKFVKIYKNEDAIRHLIEVASSIDSLVVGEREIFRQFREAYKKSRKLNVSGDNIRILEKCTVRAAKDVYTNTAIGAKPVSVVSLAIQEFLKRKINHKSKILLLGAGETNTTVGRFLKKNGYHNLIIYNRSLDNAKSLSHELGGQAHHLSDLALNQKGFDAIFACTASQDPILDLELFNSININKTKKLVIDLAIPQNIAPDLIESDLIEYINVDSIRPLAEENLKSRRQNIVAAKSIIDSYVKEFKTSYEQRKIERAFSNLAPEIEKVKHRALSQIFKEKIASLPIESQELVNDIANYMEKKCVAVPMKIAKEQAR